MTKTTKAHMALFAARLLYAASFPIAKIVMLHIPYNVLVIMRIIGAIILFWSSSFIVKEKTAAKDIPRLILLGICGVAVNQTLFLKGLSLTSPIDAAIMMIITPILVIIIASILIKERITTLRLVGIIIGFLGAAFLVVLGDKAGNKESSLIGNVFVLINAMSWGTFLVLVKPLMKKYHTVTILRWTFLFGFPMVLPFGVVDFLHFDWSMLSTEVIAYTAFVIIFTTFVAYLLNTVALKELSPSVVSAYIYTQPVLTAAITIFIFGTDQLSWEKATAALFIFIGVYMASIEKKKVCRGRIRTSTEQLAETQKY